MTPEDFNHQELIEKLEYIIEISPENVPRVREMVLSAGLLEGEVAKGKNRDHFLDSLLALAAINRGKSVGYGDYTDNYSGEAPILQAAHAYSDMKRKWVRFESLIKQFLENSGDPRPLLQMQDQLSDMGVYSIMMMEIFENLAKSISEKTTA